MDPPGCRFCTWVPCSNHGPVAGYHGLNAAELLSCSGDAAKPLALCTGRLPWPWLTSITAGNGVFAAGIVQTPGTSA